MTTENSVRVRVSEIEDAISANSMTAAQVFTQMRQLLAAPAPADSVRVPDGWRVMAFTGSFAARGERWEIYDPDGNGGGVCAGDVADESVANLLDVLTGLAAPAPAGAPDKTAWLDEVLPGRRDALARLFSGVPLEEVEQMAAEWFAKTGATPQPEQGAGLAWPKPTDGRIEWLKRWSDQGQHRRIPGASAGEAYELAIELEQLRNQWNTLARQQSRVVDEVLKLAEQMDRDSAQCRRDGYFDAAVIKSDCANRIRAALEGVRDGR